MGQDKKIATTGTATDQRSRSATSADPMSSIGTAAKDREMGSALRSVYQRTVDEAVPDDLLDLLDKLG